MRREYESYFASRFRDLRREPVRRVRARFYPPFLIDDLLSQIPKNWRTDARFYLANSMIEMIIAPYDYVEGPDIALFNGGSVWGLIVDDLHKIISEATFVAEERNREYVSATSVAIALGRVVERLQTTSLQIWGPE